jgi:hypothetical protein
MSNQTFFVEFSLCDGDDKPNSLSDIAGDDARAEGGSFPHPFSFFFEYSPTNKQVTAEYSAEMIWDGITASHLHKSDGVRAFGIDQNSQSFTGGPSPIVRFKLLGDINIDDFINQWSLTCSPREDYFFEDWSGSKRILSEDELQRRGLTGDTPSPLLTVSISEGVRSSGEYLMIEKRIGCEIDCVTTDDVEDYFCLADSTEIMDNLPNGWLQNPSHEEVLTNYQDFYEKIVDKLISDNSITHKDLLDLASYSNEQIARLSLYHPFANKDVSDRFITVHDDGDRDLESIFQHIEFNRSLPPSPWRYCGWLIDGDEGAAENILITCDWKLDPELCRLFIEYGEKLDDDYEREVLHNVLAKVVNFPDELKGKLESLADQ